MNQIRGFLLERGIAIRKGPSYLGSQLQIIFSDGDPSFSGRLLHLIRELKHEWDELERKIEEASAELARIAKLDDGLSSLDGGAGLRSDRFDSAGRGNRQRHQLQKGA